MITKERSYTHKAKVTLNIIFILVFLTLLEILYLSYAKSMRTESLEKKISFVTLTTLSDLAFPSEEKYLRHRSMSSIYSIYSDDAALREHSSLTYTISHKEVH